MLAIERRRHRRYPIDLPVRFRIVPPSHPGQASPFQIARIVELAEEGARLLTNTVYVENLHIFHPSHTSCEQCVLDVEVAEAEPPQAVRGRVVWYDHASEGSPYTFQAGLEFLDTSTDQKNQIRACIGRIKSHRC